MKTSFKQRIFAVFAGLISIIVIIACFFTNTSEARAISQVDTTLAEVERQANASLDFDGQYYINGLPLALSSNPYDYVKSNPEFDKLIAMGADAVAPLEECLANGEKYSSFDRYIIAIAIEEITKVDFKQCEEYTWEDAESFMISWEKAKSDVVKIVPEVLSDNTLTNEEKWAEIAKYGTLSIAPLQEVQQKLSSKSNTELYSDAVELAEMIENLLNTSDFATITGIAKRTITPPND